MREQPPSNNIGSKIHEAFERRGEVTEDDFARLVQFLEAQETEGPNSVELLNFSVGVEGTEVSVLLLVKIDSVGAVAEEFTRYFPAPFSIDILNNPNSDHIVVYISWGQV